MLALLCACSAPAGYSGTVQTESVAVGSQTGGRVIEVDVATGSRVHRGDIVLRLDPALLQTQYDVAVAQTRQAAQHLDELENGSSTTDIERAQAQSAQAQAQYRQAVDVTQPQIAAATDAIRDAQAAVALAKTNYSRAASLASTGDVSQQALDQARADFDQSSARLAQARSDYAALADAQLPGERAAARQNARAQSSASHTLQSGRPAIIAQARAALAAARASADHAAALLREAVVRSPADGVVEAFDLHPGDLLGPNEGAAIIDTFADPYVYIYADQRDLARFPQGQHVRVISDAGTGTYDGVVEALDRTAQFTPQNVETADQRAELVYGVKIRIHDPKHVLLDGTTVTVYQP